MRLKLENLIKSADKALRSGDTNKALNLYQKALAENPDSASALYGIGTVSMQKKDFSDGLRFLSRASAIEPHAFDIAYNHAICLTQLGKNNQALDELARASKHCKDDPYFCSAIAKLLLRLNEPGAAIQLLSRLKEFKPSDLVMMAEAQAKIGNWKHALKLWKQLSEAFPNDPYIIDQLAISAARIRDYATAINAFEKYLSLTQPTANYYLRFADLLFLSKDLDRCKQTLQHALDLGETSAEVHVLIAKVARLQADYTTALSSIDTALSQTENHGDAWFLLAELAPNEKLLELSERLHKLLAQSTKLENLDSHQQAMLYYALAKMEDRNKNYSSASQALRKANQVQFEQLEKENNVYDPAKSKDYFDQLIQSFNAKLIEDKGTTATLNDLSFRPVFIVGMPRSGTTLVERILGQSPQVTNGGEQEAMEHVALDLQHKLAAGVFSSVSNINTQQWNHLRSAYIEKIPNLDKPIFTDKLPHNFRHVGIILKLFPNAKIIQMHRDIQDVCFSIYSHAFASGHNYATQLPDTIHFYNEAKRIMAHWSSLNSPQILDLNYEDLVNEPEKYAKQLVEFCELPWNPTHLEFHQSITQSFTFSEMQVREPIATKRIGRWKNYAEYLTELANL